MRKISVSIQDGWLLRKGFRGKWITAYHHTYAGSESTERYHSHPWLLSFGFVLSGHMDEQFPGNKPKKRWRGSFRCYGRKTEHRVVRAYAKSVFVGLFRTQKPIDRAAECHTPEGYCHYTELLPGEEGFRADISKPSRID